MTTSVLEKARELGEAIQQSDEMKDFKAAEAAHNSDENTQTHMREFNTARLRLVHKLQAGEITREDAVKATNEAFDKLCEDAPLVREYVDKKAKLDATVNQVKEIINYYVTGRTGDCTHNCGTCGGCG